jgi:hypothetical protein
LLAHWQPDAISAARECVINATLSFIGAGIILHVRNVA